MPNSCKTQSGCEATGRVQTTTRNEVNEMCKCRCNRWRTTTRQKQQAEQQQQRRRRTQNVARKCQHTIQPKTQCVARRTITESYTIIRVECTASYAERKWWQLFGGCSAHTRRGARLTRGRTPRELSGHIWRHRV